MRIAAIGDIHGCIDELKELHGKLEHESLDEIWALADLVDRGPDSGAVIDFCREKGIKSVFGNHEQSVVNGWPVFQKYGRMRNPEKQTTLSQLNQDKIDWLAALPKLHVIEPLNLVLVHGGLWPVPLWAQPLNCIRAQMILQPHHEYDRSIGCVRWWGQKAITKGHYPEDYNRARGWHRWYEIYNRPENVVYGHSVFGTPYEHRATVEAGSTLGIDTGSCFGGKLTAAIIGRDWVEKFISVKPRAIYAGFKLDCIVD